VALVLIGPKDLPVAIKAVSDVVKKMRKMAGEFQSHVDEMVKDTSIAEVRQQINEIRNFDIRGEIEKAVDADGSLRSTFKDDPFRSASGGYVPPSGSHSIEAPPDADAPPDPARVHDSPAFEAPAFVPPGVAPPAAIVMHSAPLAPPAFIPPGSPAPDAPHA
jgi:sec-independent protein translocase protein TatB